MSTYYIDLNEELKGYDIIKRKGQIVEGEMKDLRVATVYDPDTIDLLIEVLDAEDKRPMDGYIVDDSETADDGAVG